MGYINDYCERRWPLLLACILLIAAGVRLPGITHGVGIHPDERFMVMVVEGMSFDKLNPGSFAYGSLPYYLNFFISEALGHIWKEASSYHGLFIVGRSICLFFGVLGVYYAFALAQAVFSQRIVSLCAAWFLCWNFFHIQLSHFFTSDIILAAFSSAALLAIVNICKRGDLKYYIWCGLWIGLSLGTKIAGLYLIACLLLSVPLSMLLNGGTNNVKQQPLNVVMIRLLIALLLAPLCFFFVSPYAIIDFSTFYAHTTEQLRMVSGAWRPPYAVQYANTTPVFYLLYQMFWWTLGPVSSLVLLLGILLMFINPRRMDWASAIALFVWIGAFFVSSLGMSVKFPRYLLPVFGPAVVFAGFGAAAIMLYIEELDRRPRIHGQDLEVNAAELQTDHL